MSLHTTRIESNQQLWVSRRFPPHVAARTPVTGNQTLSPVQIVAQTSSETGFEIIPIAEPLGVNPNDAESSLLVQIGDLVRFGTVLAERKKMFGRSTHVTSPVEGTVAEIENGDLFITRTPEDLNLRSLVHGTVSQVIPGKGVVIETFGSRFQAAWSNGNEGAGNLHVLGEAADEALQIEHLDVDLYGAVAAIGHLDQPNLLKSLTDAGVAGLIAGTVSPDVFQAITNWHLPFILTDGAGSGGIYPAIYNLLRENNGNHSALFGSKYGQTSRPEVVMISENGLENAEQKPSRREKKPTSLKVGQKIRLLSGVNRGLEGIIKKTYSWPQTTSTGIKSEGADVEFSTGEVAFVSTTNLDIIM
ncbi:MAG: hypothetical protein AB8G95_14060 [Anaerolineae bacterium]